MIYNIQQAAASTIAAYQTGQPILQRVAAYMDAAERLESDLTGPEKKKWVIEYAKKEIAEIYKNLDYWLPILFKFIDAVKAAFNALKVLF